MPHPYKYVLLVAMLLLAYFIVAYRNTFNRPSVTALRFVAAVIAVWLYLLGERLLVDYIDIRLATTPEQIESVYAGDGARNVFALFFGWVPGIFLASVCWVVGRAVCRYKHRRGQAAT